MDLVVLCQSSSTYTIPEEILSLEDSPTSQEVSDTIGGDAISAVEAGATILIHMTGMAERVQAVCVNNPGGNMYMFGFNSMLLGKSLVQCYISYTTGTFAFQKKTLIE